MPPQSHPSLNLPTRLSPGKESPRTISSPGNTSVILAKLFKWDHEVICFRCWCEAAEAKAIQFDSPVVFHARSQERKVRVRQISVLACSHVHRPLRALSRRVLGVRPFRQKPVIIARAQVRMASARRPFRCEAWLHRSSQRQPFGIISRITTQYGGALLLDLFCLESWRLGGYSHC